MNNILAVIVTYNRKELLLESINALLGQKYNKFDIYIFDNDSNDGTEEFISNYIDGKRIKYFKSSKNIGGAGGFSEGIKYAYYNKYKYCWLMDDDTVPNDDSLLSLNDKAKILSGKFSFLCSLALFKDGNICKMNIPVVHKDYIYEYCNVKNNLILVESCSFVSCFINMKYVKEIGLPIKEFFIYGDDVEYTRRLSKIEKAYIDIDSIVIHKMKVNTNTDIVYSDISKLGRAFYTFRNRFYIDHKKGIKPFIKYLLRYFSLFCKILFKSPNHKFYRIRQLSKGYLCGFFFHPKIEYINDK